jgi:hypothetical protein
VHDETSSSGNKEDEDDDEDEGEDKIDPQQYDPERLKAFNVSKCYMESEVVWKGWGGRVVAPLCLQECTTQ